MSQIFFAIQHNLRTYDLWLLEHEGTLDSARYAAIQSSMFERDRDTYRAVFRVSGDTVKLESVFYPSWDGMSSFQEARAARRVDKFLAREKPYKELIQLIQNLAD